MSDFGNSVPFSNSTILKFTRDGKFIAKWGSPGACDGQLDHPTGITVDNVGYVYIADHDNTRIQKFTGDGKFIAKWGVNGGSQFDSIVGVAVDHANNVYVVDQGNNGIQKFDSNGKFITKWGSSGAGDGKFKFADSIAADASGKNVYVTDSDNRRVTVFASTSNTTS